MTIQDIMDRVVLLYNDTDYARITQNMYLKFLDDALLQLVTLRPDTNSRIVVMQLDPGTRQTFPADMLTLIDIYRNRGQDGVTNGPPIWKVNRKDLDYFSNWHADAAVDPTTIDEYAYDTKDNKTFWVSPSPGESTPIFIELSYSYTFPTFASLSWERAVGQVLPCDESFANAVVSYMLYKLYSTDTASKTDKALADSYKTDFYSQIGNEAATNAMFLTVVGDTPIPGTIVKAGS